MKPAPLMEGRSDKAEATTPITEQVLRKWFLVLGPSTFQVDTTVLDLTRQELLGCSAVPGRCTPPKEQRDESSHKGGPPREGARPGGGTKPPGVKAAPTAAPSLALVSSDGFHT